VVSAISLPRRLGSLGESSRNIAAMPDGEADLRTLGRLVRRPVHAGLLFPIPVRFSHRAVSQRLVAVSSVAPAARATSRKGLPEARRCLDELRRRVR